MSHKQNIDTHLGSNTHRHTYRISKEIYVLCVIKIPFPHFSILLLLFGSLLWLPLGGGGEWSDDGELDRALARLLAMAASMSMLLFVGVLSSTSRKSQISIVSSCELLTIWKSSNCSRNTLPVCSYVHTHIYDDIHIHIYTTQVPYITFVHILKIHNNIHTAMHWNSYRVLNVVT